VTQYHWSWVHLEKKIQVVGFSCHAQDFNLMCATPHPRPLVADCIQGTLHFQWLDYQGTNPQIWTHPWNRLSVITKQIREYDERDKNPLCTRVSQLRSLKRHGPEASRGWKPWSRVFTSCLVARLLNPLVLSHRCVSRWDWLESAIFLSLCLPRGCAWKAGLYKDWYNDHMHTLPISRCISLNPKNIKLEHCFLPLSTSRTLSI